MFYAFVLVFIGLFAIGSFEGVDADGKIKNNISLMNRRWFYLFSDITYEYIIEIFFKVILWYLAMDIAVLSMVTIQDIVAMIRWE